MNLIGNEDDENDNIPVEQPKAKRISTGKNEINKDGFSIYNLNRNPALTVDSKELREIQEPTATLSEPGEYRRSMTSFNFGHSSKDLSKKPGAQVNWIRVSQSLLEISIEILKNSFGLDNEQIKNQQLFTRMFDLFKITIYFTCQYKHYTDLFDKVEELKDIDSEFYQCNLAKTFRIVRNFCF